MCWLEKNLSSVGTGDHPDIASYLLSLHANSEARTAYKMTPLHVAAFYGSRKVTKMLLSEVEGVDVDALDFGSCETLRETRPEQSDVRSRSITSVVGMRLSVFSSLPPPREVLDTRVCTIVCMADIQLYCTCILA